MTNWTTLPHENLIAYQVARELLVLVRAAKIRDCSLRDRRCAPQRARASILRRRAGGRARRIKRGSTQLRAVKLAKRLLLSTSRRWAATALKDRRESRARCHGGCTRS